MPVVDAPSGEFVVRSRLGGTHYRTGAGRTLWGEGLESKPSKEAKRQATKKTYRITEKRKGADSSEEAEEGRDGGNDSDSE